MTTRNWYRYELGVIVGGPYNCDQSFPVVERPDDHPDVVAFMAPPPVLPPQPDWDGFLASLDAQLTFAQINEMYRLYGMFISWCQFGNAPRIQECILDAQANHPDLMTPAVYALFQQAVTTYHIPVVLP